MDVHAEVGEVVEVFAGHEPYDLADCAFGVEAGYSSECAGFDLLVSCELGDIVERGAFGVGEERTVAVPIEGVEFIDVHRRFGREESADIHAEQTDVDTRHLFAN